MKEKFKRTDQYFGIARLAERIENLDELEATLKAAIRYAKEEGHISKQEAKRLRQMLGKRIHNKLMKRIQDQDELEPLLNAAIDLELENGNITEKQAQRLRRQISRRN